MTQDIVGSLRAMVQGPGGDRTARNVAWSLFGALLIIVAVYAWQYPPGEQLTIAGGLFLIALSAVAIGGFLGFLFGLPRRTVVTSGATSGVPATGAPAPYTSNTNLEDISDWVTKILVGITLTQLGTLPAVFDGLVTFLRGALQKENLVANAGAIAAMLAVAYAIGGFFVVYLWARLRFGAALADADREIAAAERHRQAAQIQRDTAQLQVEAAQHARAAAVTMSGIDPTS